MSKLSNEQVTKLAKLARLSLSNDEVEKYKKELDEILEYVNLLSSVDTSDLAPTNQVTGLHSVYRKDEVKDYQAKPVDLLGLAPDRKDAYIKVKRMI